MITVFAATAVDNSGAALTVSTAVYKNDEQISVTDGSFIAELGCTYKIEFAVVDNAGNRAERSFSFTTVAASSDEPDPQPTPEPEPQKKGCGGCGGCRGMLGAGQSLVAACALMGVAFTVARRRNKK